MRSIMSEASVVPWSDQPVPGIDGSMSVTDISLILRFDRPTVKDSIEVSLNIGKRILSFIPACSETLETIPVHILSGPIRVDMLTVSDIKLTVIVFWIVDSILSSTAIVPCHFHFFITSN